MRPERPEPGSTWQRHCPHAWPRPWLENGKKPDGFTRVATPEEFDLIAGRIGEAEFLGKTRRRRPSSSPPQSPRSKRKPTPVVLKLFGWNQFFDSSGELEPRLPPLAVAVWCWLQLRTREGLATTSERQLEARFGVTRKTLRTSLRALEAVGYLELRTRGRWNQSPTVYSVRSAPRSGVKTDIEAG